MKLLQVLHDSYLPALIALGTDVADDPYVFGVGQLLTSHVMLPSCPGWGQWRDENPARRPPCSCHGRFDTTRPPAELVSVPIGRDMPATAEFSAVSQ
jgi:hypothetical protein